MMRVGPIAVFLAVTVPGVLHAQARVSITPRARPTRPVMSSRANLRLDVELVQVPVVVTDPLGKPVLQLPKDAFRVFEDEVEQPITSFVVNDAPISATLVFDSSRSMKSRIAEARAAVEQLLKTALPGDDFSLVRFSDKVEVLSPFTTDPDVISSRLGTVEPRGWTALYDALCLGAHLARKGQNQRKVMVAFSDGEDNNSRYSESELASLLRESDVELYAIGIFDKPRSLEKLANETGGRALWVRKLEDLPDAIETLSRQIRSEYVLGYAPEEMQKDGKYHRVRVEVQPPPGSPPVRASWKRGYTAPGA